MFSNPDEVVKQLGIREGEVVADFGCGAGTYSIAIARALNGSGRVYAIDVQKDILTRVQNTAKEEGVGGIVSVIWGNLEIEGGTKIKDQTVDLVILANVLFQSHERSAMVREARRILRHGGRVLVIDWVESFNNLGPRPHDIVTEHEVAKIFEEENFSFDRHIDAGPHHYGHVYRKGIYHSQK